MTNILITKFHNQHLGVSQNIVVEFCFAFPPFCSLFCIKMEQKFAKQGKSAKKHEKQYLASRCGARDPFIGRNIQKEAHIEKS